MNDRQISDEFYIEEHATLYALIAKKAIELCGDPGFAAVEEATKLYGLERGGRMAKRALRDGKELTMMNYTQYSEWTDTRGESAGAIESYNPDYITITTRCGWCEAWKKHNLLDYGKIYCQFIDEYLVKGFNPENQLIISKTLSAGDELCHFCWAGASFRNEADYDRDPQGKEGNGRAKHKGFSLSYRASPLRFQPKTHLCAW